MTLLSFFVDGVMGDCTSPQRSCVKVIFELKRKLAYYVCQVKSSQHAWHYMCAKIKYLIFLLLVEEPVVASGFGSNLLISDKHTRKNTNLWQGKMFRQLNINKNVLQF